MLSQGRLFIPGDAEDVFQLLNFVVRSSQSTVLLKFGTKAPLKKL
jgi:hypothetical protein